MDANVSLWIISFSLCIYMLLDPTHYNLFLPIFILTLMQIQIMESIMDETVKDKYEKNIQYDMDYNFLIGNVFICFLYLLAISILFLYPESKFQYIIFSFIGGMFFLISSLKYRKIWGYFGLVTSLIAITIRK
jgi:hypothetical protein